LITRRDILVKAANFCAYQERTHAEVRERLQKWEVWGDEAEEIIAFLITDNFLNEERFAKIFAGSKFRVKQWGRQVGMAEIDDDDYLETLKDILEKKKHELRTEKQPLIIKQKLARYALGKGFESDLVWEMIAKIMAQK
jgi:regulatory protein